MRRNHRSGVSLVYVIITMSAMLLLASLAVDYGRVQLTKAQLEDAANAAARAGAAGLATDPSAAVSEATRIASLNTADGSAVALDPSRDIEIGSWDAGSRTFTRLTGDALYRANAVHVIAQRTADRNDAVPLLFARVYGRGFCDVHADAYALMIPGVNVNQTVQATANPFLAGMPRGSVASLNNPHNSPDYAGSPGNWLQSPLVVNMPLVSGTALTFDSITGVAGHDPHLLAYNPDGELSDIGHNTNGSENGISDLVSPINALVGVFLDDNQPNLTTAPQRLDFSTAESRDFTKLQPQLKQLFFIGDGKNSAGGVQQFIVPKGATRLYLATWDFYEWNNNYGYRNIKILRPPQVATVGPSPRPASQ